MEGLTKESALREAPICAAAVAKLRADGWLVACEVAPLDFRDRIDAGAIREDKALALEAKVSLSRSLRHQVYRRQLVADFVLAVVGRMPKAEGVEWCRAEGVGLWVVRNGTVVEVVEWRQQEAHESYRLILIEKVKSGNGSAIGGLPNQKGVGPAQDVQRRVDEYRAAHPKVTWKEVFANVPSHYATAANMSSALRSNRERLAWRRHQKERVEWTD